MHSALPPQMTSLLSLSAIEFPGVLRKSHDPRNAIAALGGEDAVRTALSIQTAANALSLNLRPHPTASPSNITSEKPYSPTNLFLLRITTPPTLDLGPSSHHHHSHDARIVGHVTSLVRFRTLADFQYHVPRSIPTPTPTIERHIATHTVFEALANYPKPSTVPTPQNLLDTLRPRRFARTQPEYGHTDYGFKQYAYSNVADPHARHTLVPGRPLGDDRRSDANRLSLLHHRVTMDVVRVPQCPPEVDRQPVQRGRETYGELYQLLSKLFQIRPIWIRRALYEGVPQRLRKSFKKAISMIAYSFQGTGPFYQAWIRYGYDPRQDPSSRQYQVVEVRITNAVILAAQSEQYQHENSDTEQELAPATEEATSSRTEEPQYPEPFHMPASFTLTKIPKKKNNFIQVCDIKLEDVVKVCEDEEATKEFDPKFGFFTEAGFQRLAATIKETLFSICEERLGAARAREILGASYSKTKRVAKKRRRLYLKDVIRPHEGQPSSVVPANDEDQGEVTPSSPEMPRNEDDQVDGGNLTPASLELPRNEDDPPPQIDPGRAGQVDESNLTPTSLEMPRNEDDPPPQVDPGRAGQVDGSNLTPTSLEMPRNEDDPPPQIDPGRAGQVDGGNLTLTSLELPRNKDDPPPQIDPGRAGQVHVGEAVSQVADLVEEEEGASGDDDDDDDDGGDDEAGEYTEETGDRGGIEGFEILGEEGEEEDSEDDYT